MEGGASSELLVARLMGGREGGADSELLVARLDREGLT